MDVPLAETENSPATINKHDIRFLLDSPQEPPSLQPQLPLNLSPLRRYSPPSLVSPVYLSSPLSSVAPTTACKDCSFIATTPEELSSHVRTTHRIKPFACKVCDKTFAERGNANKHYRVAHLKQRNHKCPTCDRCFAFRDGLNRHISMVHLNQRPFECTECMCPNGPHPRAVPCTHICGMRFKQKSHRRRHVLSVHHAAGAGKRVASVQHPFADATHLQMAAQQAAHVS